MASDEKPINVVKNLYLNFKTPGLKRVNCKSSPFCHNYTLNTLELVAVLQRNENMEQKFTQNIKFMQNIRFSETQDIKTKKANMENEECIILVYIDFTS